MALCFLPSIAEEAAVLDRDASEAGVGRVIRGGGGIGRGEASVRRWNYPSYRKLHQETTNSPRLRVPLTGEIEPFVA